MPETAWETTKKLSNAAYTKAVKPGLEKVYETVDRFDNQFLSTPSSAATDTLKPVSLSRDCEIAACVLRGFCQDGFYVDDEDDPVERVAAPPRGSDVPQQERRLLKTIPDEVIREAKGLAIFTITRSTRRMLDAGGSGVLLARNHETGQWSPPSGIELQANGLQFLPGMDVYDGVAVMNTHRALHAFTSLRCTMGDDLDLEIGPLRLGETWDTDARRDQDIARVYIKCRDLYAPIQLDGTVVVERAEENESFYQERISVADIVAGKAQNPPKEQYRILSDMIHAAQRQRIADHHGSVPSASPRDLRIETEARQFGIPDVADPDPYGVKALQAEGLEIREAGTRSRPRPETFSFKPAPSSPVYSNFRKSVEMQGRANSWRGSMLSITSMDRATQTTDEEPTNANYSPRRKDSTPPSSIGKDPAGSLEAPATPTPDESSVTEPKSASGDKADKDFRQHPSPKVDEVGEREEGEEGPDGDMEDLDVLQPQHSQIITAVPVVARARMVTVPKRIPPSLPPRNPNRTAVIRDHPNNGDGPGPASPDSPVGSDNRPETLSAAAKIENNQAQPQT